MSEIPEFYTSNRGAKKLIFKGYQYGRGKEIGQKIYWKCEDRTCKGRLITDTAEQAAVLKETPHTAHGPNMADIEVKKSLARLKEAASQGQDAPSTTCYLPIPLRCTV